MIGRRLTRGHTLLILAIRAWTGRRGDSGERIPAGDIGGRFDRPAELPRLCEADDRWGGVASV